MNSFPIFSFQDLMPTETDRISKLIMSSKDKPAEIVLEYLLDEEMMDDLYPANDLSMLTYKIALKNLGYEAYASNEVAFAQRNEDRNAKMIVEQQNFKTTEELEQNRIENLIQKGVIYRDILDANYEDIDTLIYQILVKDLMSVSNEEDEGQEQDPKEVVATNVYKSILSYYFEGLKIIKDNGAFQIGKFPLQTRHLIEALHAKNVPLAHSLLDKGVKPDQNCMKIAIFIQDKNLISRINVQAPSNAGTLRSAFHLNKDDITKHVISLTSLEDRATFVSLFGGDQALAKKIEELNVLSDDNDEGFEEDTGNDADQSSTINDFSDGEVKNGDEDGWGEF